MKKRVLYYALQPNDTTSFWRLSGVLPFINNSEFELIDASLTVNFNWSTFIGVSIFILQRPFKSEHAALIALAKDCSVKVILDYDDNLFEVDMYNPTHLLYLQSKSIIQDCVLMADEVWVSTKSIGDDYNHLNTHVIKNAHNDYLFPVKNKLPFINNNSVLYRGGGSHKADVFEKAEMLVNIINSNPDYTFTFMGDRFEFIEQRTGDNHHIVGGLSIMQYFKYLHNLNPSNAIFPLCTTKFNEGKSNISWIESTFSGASFWGNKQLPEFNMPGILDINEFDPKRISNNDHNESWTYIQDNLLLSQVNKIRTERILANL